MGGATLALAPACIALAGWVTWAHLRRLEARPVGPSPLAWLAPAHREGEQRPRLSLHTPWLCLLRLALIAVMLSLPVTYLPWTQLLQGDPRGTLVLVTGPITVNPSWERPLWFISPSPHPQRYRWLNQEGEAHPASIEVNPVARTVDAPRLESLTQLEEGDLERALLSARAALTSRGTPVRDVLIAQAPSPALLGARLSWRASPDHEDAQLTLYLEAQLQTHPTATRSAELVIEAQRASGWEPFQALALKEGTIHERGLWETSLNGSDAEVPLRLCLKQPSGMRECLGLTRPSRVLKVSRSGWPEGVALILKALPEVEWVEEREADWVSQDGQAAERSALLKPLTPRSKATRAFVFIEGRELEAPLWGEDLSFGTFEQVKEWRALPELSLDQLKSLAPWMSAKRARTLTHALITTGAGPTLSPVLRSWDLIGHRRSLQLVMVGWRPRVDDELTTLTTHIEEWAALQRSTVVTYKRGPLPTWQTRQEQHQTLAALLGAPYHQQREQSVSLDHAPLSPDADPIEPAASPLWLLCALSALLSTLSRARLSGLTSAVCALWALSASPPGCPIRGVGGLWLGSPTVQVTLDGSSQAAHQRALERWRAWRPSLLSRGVSLSGAQRGEELALHFGGAPLKAAHHTRWLIPTARPRAPVRVHTSSSAWSADLSGLWVSATLSAEVSALTHERYELWLTSPSGQRFMGSCQGDTCVEWRAVALCPDPRGALTLSLYRHGEQRAERALIEERVVRTPERPAQQVAWTWGQQSAPWINAAGYLRRPAQRLDQLPPDEVQLISIHDTPAERISAEDAEVLDRWVRAGGTLLLSGRAQSFDQGGWLGTPLDRLSPLHSRAASSDRARVLFLLDVSGSVSREAGGPGVSGLIEESLSLAAQLNPQDEVALISFAGEAELLIPPTPRADLSAVVAPSSGSGGSVVSAALSEALRWLGERGPQRWVLLTDGELSATRLSEVLENIQRTRAQRDLSLLVGLTSERHPSPSGDQVLKALKHSLGAHVTPLSQLTPAAFVSWRDEQRSASASHGTPDLAQQVWGTPWGQGRLGAQLPAVKGGAGVQLKPGATLLAERQTPSGRQPLLAEWRYGLGRVVALATDQWGLSPQGWRALLPSAQRERLGGWRFTWRAQGPALIASGPVGAKLSSRAVILGPQGELTSGRWSPLLGGGASLRAQDGGALDERARRFDSVVLRSQTPSGLINATLFNERSSSAPRATAHDVAAPFAARVLSEREAAQPSPALLDQLTRAASPPAPLPSGPLVLLLIALTWVEVRVWRGRSSART